MVKSITLYALALILLQLIIYEYAQKASNERDYETLPDWVQSEIGYYQDSSSFIDTDAGQFNLLNSRTVDCLMSIKATP